MILKDTSLVKDNLHVVYDKCSWRRVVTARVPNINTLKPLLNKLFYIGGN